MSQMKITGIKTKIAPILASVLKLSLTMKWTVLFCLILATWMIAEIHGESDESGTEPDEPTTEEAPHMEQVEITEEPKNDEEDEKKK